MYILNGDEGVPSKEGKGPMMSHTHDAEAARNERTPERGGCAYLPALPACLMQSIYPFTPVQTLTHFFLIPPLVSGPPPRSISHHTRPRMGRLAGGTTVTNSTGEREGYLDGTCVTEPPQKFNGKRKKQLCDDDNTPLLFFLSSSFAPLSPHLSSGMHLIHLVTQP